MSGLRTVRTNELELVHSRTGKYYVPAHAYSDCIVHDIKAGRVFEEEVYAIARSFIRENTIVLDVGSNFGQMAIMMSRHVGPEGCVYAFDADDFVYSILEKNIAINEAPIKAHFGAVHNVGGETLYFPVQDFVRFGAYGSYGIDYVNHQGRPVPTITIDELEYPMPVSFMKVDVQGGDLFAMQGAVETIERFRMPIIFEYEKAFEAEQGYCFEDYRKFIKEIKYTVKMELNHNYLILPKERKR